MIRQDQAGQAGPGKTVAVVGDGAVGLLSVLAAKQLGVERIIAAVDTGVPRQQVGHRDLCGDQTRGGGRVVDVGVPIPP